jgi:hypothetical protein
MTKIAGSGSISQRHGSSDPDPDPPQNVMDPQHYHKHYRIFQIEYSYHKLSHTEKEKKKKLLCVSLMNLYLMGISTGIPYHYCFTVSYEKAIW